MCRLGPLKLPDDAFHLALLGNRNRHIEVEPHDVALELGSSQQPPQLVEVPTPHVNPAPERNALRAHAWTQPLPKQRDERDGASVRFIEPGRLRRTRIHGRDRRAWRHVAKRMGITDREIVQPAQCTRIAGDRKVRLISVNVERAAVYATYTDPRVTRLPRRKRHR
jgi:hypothetical protein